MGWAQRHFNPKIYNSKRGLVHQHSKMINPGRRNPGCLFKSFEGRKKVVLSKTISISKGITLKYMGPVPKDRFSPPAYHFMFIFHSQKKWLPHFFLRMEKRTYFLAAMGKNRLVRQLRYDFDL